MNDIETKNKMLIFIDNKLIKLHNYILPNLGDACRRCLLKKEECRNYKLITKDKKELSVINKCRIMCDYWHEEIEDKKNILKSKLDGKIQKIYLVEENEK